MEKKIAERLAIEKNKKEAELDSLGFQADNLSKFLEGIKLELAATSK